MAYEQTGVEYRGISAGTYSWIADTVADLANIPISDDVACGSTCYVTETKEVYILSASRTWAVM